MITILKTIALAVCLVGFVGCEEKTPQELRADFEDIIEVNFMLKPPPIRGIRVTEDAVKCAIKRMSDSFSDEEIRLYLDSSMGEAMDNMGKIIPIQARVDSDEVKYSFLLQCMAEIKGIK